MLRLTPVQAPNVTKPKVTPVKPDASFKITGTDYTNEVSMVVCYGSAALLYVNRRDGKPSYKSEFNKALLEKKPGTEDLHVLHICEYKVDRTADSEIVKVGKKDITDKLAVVYFDESMDSKALLKQSSIVFSKYSKTYDKKGNLACEAGTVINEGDLHFLDEHIPLKAVAAVIVALYPDQMHSFENDDEVSTDIVNRYVSLTSLDEAKQVVLDCYKEKKK